MGGVDMGAAYEARAIVNGNPIPVGLEKAAVTFEMNGEIGTFNGNISNDVISVDMNGGIFTATWNNNNTYSIFMRWSMPDFPTKIHIGEENVTITENFKSCVEYVASPLTLSSQPTIMYDPSKDDTLPTPPVGKEWVVDDTYKYYGGCLINTKGEILKYGELVDAIKNKQFVFANEYNRFYPTEAVFDSYYGVCIALITVLAVDDINDTITPVRYGIALKAV